MDVISQQKFYQIETVPNNYFDIVFYKQYNHNGAFPQMIRDSFNIKEYSNSVFFPVRKEDKCLLISTSSFFTFFSCLILKLKGIEVTLAPLGQLHTFLDEDNPFEFGDSFKNKGWELKENSSRRLNGKKSFKTYIRKLYRKIWKFFFVKLMFKISNKVLVLSNHEAGLVCSLNKRINLVRLNAWNYKPYKKEGIILNLDKSKVNLIYWGRVDIYYKGLDILIEAVKDLNNTILYISGGDYRGGKEKIDFFIKQNNVKNIIIEEEVISYKNLKDFDYMILPSRWEGFFRAPLDAKANNLKVICRESLNYDFYVTGKDILFSNDLDLKNVLNRINKEKND